jgi:hypothetical protein
VEKKTTADFLASYMCQSGLPTTSIHGDRSGILLNARDGVMISWDQLAGKEVVCAGDPGPVSFVKNNHMETLESKQIYS